MVDRIRDWRPDPGQMALWPGVSGNAVNGLGETDPRPARHVYWAADPGSIPHGPLQRWFYARNDHPEMAEARAARMADQATPRAPVAPVTAAGDPAALTAALRAQAFRLGAEAVGVARMQPGWVFEGREVPERCIVLLGFAMDHDTLSEAPRLPAGVEVMRQYTRAVAISRRLADWLHGCGHAARPETGPMANDVLLVPAAIAAGMGELGRHGSIINRDLGACFRLGSVLTDAELLPDAPDDFGADEFCARCRICTNYCPPGAILPEKQTVRGAVKWYVDFDRCLPFFNETAGCAICLAVCPFSDPDKGPSLVTKLGRRRARLNGA